MPGTQGRAEALLKAIKIRGSTAGALRAQKLQALKSSSRPREFTPTVGIATADAAGFDQAYASCSQLMVAGKLDQQGRAGSLGGGAAVGATTAAVGAGTAAALGGYVGLAAAAATVVLLPFAVIGGAWGASKMKRSKKEAAIKEVIGGCLQERGYSVASWERAIKRRSVSPAIAVR